MAHTTDRIYIDTSVTPNIGVSVADVAYVLGSSSKDIGTLCTLDSKIAKWAKYRPVEAPLYWDELTDAKRRAVNWGIGNIPTWTLRTPQEMCNFWSGIGTSSPLDAPDCGPQQEWWTKVLPSTRYRLLDFNNYYHKAGAPIFPFSVQPDLGDNNALEIVYPAGVQDTYALALADFAFHGAFAGDMYFGVVFYNGTDMYIVTQRTPLSRTSVYYNGYVVNIADASRLVGTWQVWPILSSVRFDLDSEDVPITNGIYVAIFEPVSCTFTLNKASYSFEANYATHDSGSRLVEYSFNLMNNGGSMLTNITIRIDFKNLSDVVVATTTKTVTSLAAGASTVVSGKYSFPSAVQAGIVYSVLGTVTAMDQRFDVQYATAIVNELTP